jgi:hypothetical protein
MKSILSSLIITLGITLSAQSYIPINTQDTTGVWSVFKEKLYFKGDSLFDGHIYKNVPKTAGLVDATGKLIRDITYTPDFLSEKHNFVIETKGFVPSQHTFHLRWKLFLHYLQSAGKNYSLFLPRNKAQVDEAIKIIKNAIQD